LTSLFFPATPQGERKNEEGENMITDEERQIESKIRFWARVSDEDKEEAWQNEERF